MPLWHRLVLERKRKDMVQRPIVQRQRIGPAIRRLRRMNGLTLDDLASQAGISASHLSRLERGQTLPSFLVLSDPDKHVKAGDKIRLRFDASEAQFFDPKTERSLLWS